MNFLDFVSSFFDYFGVDDGAVQVSAAAFIGVYAVVAILRVWAACSYRARAAALKFSIRPIKTKEDIKGVKNLFTRAILIDYVSLCERGVTGVDARAVVVRRVNRLGFGALNSVGAFCSAMETACLPVGLVGFLAFGFDPFAAAVAALTFGALMLVKLLFNFAAARDNLVEETIYYVEREAGALYSTDAGNAVIRMKNEIKQTLNANAQTLDKAVKELAETLKNDLTAAAQAMAKQTAAACQKIEETGLGAMKPLLEFGNQLEKSAAILKEEDDAAVKMTTATKAFTQAVDAGGEGFKNFAAKTAENGKLLGEEVTRLVAAVSDLRDAHAQTAGQAAINAAALDELKGGRGALQAAVEGYEAAIRGLAAEMGGIVARSAEFGAKELMGKLPNNGDGGKTLEALTERFDASFKRLEGYVKGETAMLKSIAERLSGEEDLA